MQTNMKKTLLLFTAMVAMLTLYSCGGGNTYENKELNYSVQMPEGFAPQNSDAAMEKERGGKLYVNEGGCMIDVTGKKMDYAYITAEESLKQGYEFAKLAEGQIASDLQADHYWVKFQDSFGYRAVYEMQKNGVSVNVSLTYPTEKKAEFEKDCDAVLQSVDVK